jgi:hypothetical protein
MKKNKGKKIKKLDLRDLKKLGGGKNAVCGATDIVRKTGGGSGGGTSVDK